MVKRALVAILIWLAVGAIGGCRDLPGTGYEVRIPEAELQEKLDKRFPRTKTYLLVVQVTLEHPRVHLDNGSRRIGVGLDFEVSLGLGGQRNPLRGSLDSTTGLTYAPASGEFFLSDPVIERLSIEGLAPRQTERVRLALSTALSEHALTRPVYSLKQTDIKQAAAKLVLKDVVVDQGDLVLSMGL